MDFLFGDTYRDAPAKKAFRDYLPRDGSDEGRALAGTKKRQGENDRGSCRWLSKFSLVGFVELHTSSDKVAENSMGIKDIRRSGFNPGLVKDGA